MTNETTASERERFEAWASGAHERHLGGPFLTRGADGDYAAFRTFLAWSAWQARAALPAPADQPPSQEAREYPPMPEPAIGFPWRINAKDGSVHSSAFTAEQMRSYVDADQKARQQEAHRPMRWPKERDLFRADDMGEGQLRVLFDSDNDVIVALWPDGKPSVSVEFCCPGSGGGKSPRTREALIALMVAMEEDGATNRPHDAAIAKGERHE